MAKLVNRAKMTTATSGTGAITLGSALSGFQSFADAGVADQETIRYVIEDGSDWEVGEGIYTASGTTLTRTVLESSNSDAALNLSGDAIVYVSAAAEDIVKPNDSPTFGDITISDKIIHAGDTNTTIRFPAADTVTVETGGVERLRVDAVGRVGINTQPNLPFQVAALTSSSVSSIAATEVNYSSNFRGSLLEYWPIDAIGSQLGVSRSNLGSVRFLNTAAAAIGTNNAAPLVFSTTNTERLRITSAGNVGIGTSSPLESLHIADTTPAISIEETDTGVRSRIFGSGGDLFIDVDVTSSAGGSDIVFRNDTAESMRITSTGNVGIGTSTPSEKLSVTGNISVTGTVDGRDLATDGTKLDTISTFGLSLIDDADASAARATLGLGTMATQATTSYLTATETETAIETTTINTQTFGGSGTYTLVLSDRGQTVVTNTAGSNTVQIPLNSSVAFATGSVITVVQRGTGQTTIAGATGATGVTVNGTSGGSVAISAQYQGVSLLKVDTDTWIVSGAI